MCEVWETIAGLEIIDGNKALWQTDIGQNTKGNVGVS